MDSLIDPLATPGPHAILRQIAYIRSHSGYEEPLVDYITNILDRYRVPYRLDPLGGYSYNVIIGSENPELAIITHLDTIPRKGRIIVDYFDKFEGPGIVDAKAGVALAVASALKFPLDKIQVALLSQEETTGLGSAKYLEHYRPKYALVLEPTDSRLAFRGNGMISGELVCYGEEMHPDWAAFNKDKNAIIRLLEALKKLEYLNIAPTEISSNGSEFYTPSEARAYIDISIEPGKDPYEILYEIRREASELDCTFLVEDIDYGFETKDESFIKMLSEHYSKVYGEVKLRTMPSRTDANNLAKKGIPVAIFGPGKFERIHTDREKIEYDELSKAFKFLYLFLYRFVYGTNLI